MMIGMAVLSGMGVASIELLRASQLLNAFQKLSAHGRRSLRLVMRIQVSDWAKERALKLASARMFALSFASAWRLALVGLPLGLAWAINEGFPFGLADIGTSWYARIALVLVTIAYAGLRRAVPEREQVLQHIALGLPPVVDLTFEIERALYGKAAAKQAIVAPVFIAGLARAGTTILTRALHTDTSFSSLSYRDLPFPLAPNSWAALSKGWSRSVDGRERGHGDGIHHDLDSPEAIEEIFWLSQDGKRYRHRNHIIPVEPSAETIAAFRDYVRLTVLRYQRPRYLSKNNANILRLSSLVDAFPDTHLIHPFRDPLQHAASLRHQHLRACALAEQDPFRVRFMGWLGHHEFGADHRPLLLPAGPEPGEDPTRIDYWLRVWIAVQRFLLNQPPKVRARQLFLDFDAMCVAPARTAETLALRLGLREAINLEHMRSPVPYIGSTFSPGLLSLARTIHAELACQSRASIDTISSEPGRVIALRAAR